MMHTSIGIVIPTFQAAKHLPYCLPPLLRSLLKPRILIIDSSSTDGTAEIASSMGAEVLIIPQQQFNHGLTREQGRQYLRTSIILMMTQDAYATSSDMIEHLVKPIVEKKHLLLTLAKFLIKEPIFLLILLDLLTTLKSVIFAA